MDGVLLWNTLYGLVRRVDARWTGWPAGRGHPDEYSVGQIAACWLWSAFAHLPLAVAAQRLGDARYRRSQRALGLRLPARCPHETTLRRRGRRPDFWFFLAIVGMLLIRRLAPDVRVTTMDSTPLPVPPTSRDRDATWGHHRLHGYRLHTLAAGRTILVWSVQGAHVHELTVAPILVRQAAGWGWRPRYVSADHGYDSEPLHREVRAHLGGTLVAPFNDRGGRRAMRRTPLRRRLWARWRTPVIRRVRACRGAIERAYSLLKCGHFGLYALPPWVRGQGAVERWLGLKVLLYHTYLLTHPKTE